MKPTKVTVILDRPVPLFGPAGAVQRVTGVVDANSRSATEIVMDVDGKSVLIYRPFVVALVVEEGEVISAGVV